MKDFDLIQEDIITEILGLMEGQTEENVKEMLFQINFYVNERVKAKNWSESERLSNIDKSLITASVDSPLNNE